MNTVAVFYLIQALLVAAPGGSWQMKYETIAGPYYDNAGLALCQSHQRTFYAISSSAPYGQSPLIGCFQVQ